MAVPFLLIQKRPIPGTIWADFAVPLRAEFPSDSGRVLLLLLLVVWLVAYARWAFRIRNKKVGVFFEILRGRVQK